MGAKIYNSNLTKEIIDGAKLQVQDGNIPSEIGNTVVPVMEVNPKLMRRANVALSITATNATSSTIYNIPSDKEFYLTSVYLSLVKDVTATSTISTINGTLDGTTTGVALISLKTTTLTAESQNAGLTFTFPLKLKSGSAITVTNSTNVANVSANGIITGYLVDNTKA